MNDRLNQRGHKDSSQRIQDAYDEHKSVLVAYIARFFLRPEDMEDILQETVLKTLEAADLQHIRTPKAYLFITARNLIMRRLKQQSRELILEINDLDERFFISQDVAADVKMYNKEKLRVFLEATNSLPPQCRRVFILRKLYGYSHKDIAKKLRISTSTVERHISNAIKRSKTMMEKKGYEVDYIHAPTAQKNTRQGE